MQIWLTILASWPEPGRPHQVAGAGIGGDDLLRARERFGVAAAHHGERAVLGAGLAAGYRRVDALEAALLGLGMKLAGDLGGGRGVVDEDGALAQPVKGAAVAERDLAQIGVVADTRHDEVLAVGGLLGRRGEAAAELGDPLLRLGGGAIDRP